jgi:enolase
MGLNIININKMSEITSSGGHVTDELEEKIEKLLRRTDVEYARECATRELLEEYNSYVLSDAWFEAFREYTLKRVKDICDRYPVYRIPKSIYDPLYDHLSARNDTSISYMASNDIVLQIKDDIQIKISELHNESPEPNGYELEKFIIKYCREYYGI